MDTQNLISIQQFCTHYNVPKTFINALKDYDLIEIIIIKEEHYIHLTQINEVEKMMRLHYDLDINFAGIDAIYNLLKQVDALKQEINTLHNKLRFYEDL
ncbi:chaperone modulator CbpM [Snuella sedimenti]|uniref:Chaperone modulator CbpM n=1 Tax=Snuella sedimenti TaxID=2798802 RepID=A0A8J7IT57_9FLAO|nr:chaperone modulator CbpM [Snuella sedimenti]MBJ6367490.1 chaperone modulator CbpM [Snuella sedimenti]